MVGGGQRDRDCLSVWIKTKPRGYRIQVSWGQSPALFPHPGRCLSQPSPHTIGLLKGAKCIWDKLSQMYFHMKDTMFPMHTDRVCHRPMEGMTAWKNKEDKLSPMDHSHATFKQKHIILSRQGHGSSLSLYTSPSLRPPSPWPPSLLAHSSFFTSPGPFTNPRDTEW